MVVGSNFAPGTTAADIQSALEPIAGPMLSCRVIGHHPMVTAEFEYADKWNAENVVANFHNQRVRIATQPNNLYERANKYSRRMVGFFL